MQTKSPRGFSNSLISALDQSFARLSRPIKQEKTEEVFEDENDDEDYEEGEEGGSTDEDELEPLNQDEYFIEEDEDEELGDNPPLLSFFEAPGTYTVTGNTGSGKSVFVEHIVKGLIKLNPDIFGVYVFSSSADLNTDYDWVPKNMVFSNQATIETDLTNFFARRHNEQVLANKRGESAMPCIAIVDDPTGTFKNLHGVSGKVSAITEWATKLRKTNTHLFLICQRWNSYSTITRDNNKCMVFFSPGQEELEACYKDSNLSENKKDFFYSCSIHFKNRFSFLVCCDKKVYLYDPIKI